MSRYLDPANDIAFKRLFGTEDHKPLLISFLNAMLGHTGNRTIVNVELLPQEQVPEIKELKTSILDIKCTDQRKVQYIVEMQNRKVPGFVKRTQYYVAHSYVNQLSKGMPHLELKPVVLLAIVNHELFPNKDNVISYHKTLDTDTFENDLEDLAYVFLELPKFNKSESELVTAQDKWIYFFKNWHSSNHVPATVSEEEIIEAYNVIEEFNWTKPQKEAYLKATIAHDEAAAIKQEEFNKGLEKGIEEGVEKGRKEAQLMIAQALLLKGLEISQVSETTGISEAELGTFES